MGTMVSVLFSVSPLSTTHPARGYAQYIMNLKEFFNEALNFTAKIDFSKSQTPDTVRSVHSNTNRIRLFFHTT